ncbi:MAG: SBBP repeat-containing protein [candidate division WOR-3 bacterium]
MRLREQDGRKKLIVTGLLLLPLMLTGPLSAQLWVRTYDGPSHAWDKSMAVALDPEGNVLLTGHAGIIESNGDTTSYYCTMKYGPDGTRHWVRLLGPGFASAIAADSSGNAYVTGCHAKNTKDIALTIKYTSSGQLDWVRSIPGGWGSDIAFDRKNNNVYVTGFFFDSASGSEYALLCKYDLSGNCEWIRIDPLGAWTVSISLDSSGNIYTAGYSRDAMFMILKYSPDGELLWRYQQVSGYAFKVKATPAGDVYATGSLPYYQAVYTVKLNSQGQELWWDVYDGPGYDIGQSLDIDAQGNCYVTGPSARRAGIMPSFDFLTIKYTPDGTRLWERRYNDTIGDDYPFAIGVDSRGNVYVGGWSQGPRDTVGIYWGDDYTLIKYDPEGNLVWEARYVSPDSIAGWIYALAIDNEDNVITTGFVITGTRQAYDYDWCTIKYPPTGPGITEKPATASNPSLLLPNPVRPGAVLDLPAETGEFRFFDSSGRLLQTGTITGHQLQLTSIKPGVYFVQLRLKNGIRPISAKFIVGN